jgi:hypothetical protein
MATSQSTIVDKNTLKTLEISSGLKPTGGGVNLDTFKANGDDNQYAARLDMLVNGKNSIGHVWAIGQGDPYPITGGPRGTYVNFVKWCRENHLLETLQKQTPAGQKGELVTGGLLGIDALLTSQMFQNPITGPGHNTPCLGADLLNSIHPGMVDGIENFCNIIRTRSYLSLPPGAFGGLSSFLYKVQGAVKGFIQALYNIYHGVLLVMQRFANMVNGLLQAINQFIYDFISYLIPLDLICAILGAFQSLLDDVAFFAQLFGGGDGIFNAINGIQTVINFAAQGLSYAYNPISLAGLIPGVNDVFAALNQLSSDPEAFLGHLISHFGFSMGAGNKAIQIANAIILHYGLESQLGPLGSLLLTQGVAGNSSQWYRTGNTGTGGFGNLAYGNVIPNPGYIDPDNPFSFLDVNSNPYFNAAKTNITDFKNNVNDIPAAAGAAAQDIGAIPGNIASSVNNFFNPNAPQQVAPVTPTPVTGNTAPTAQ